MEIVKNMEQTVNNNAMSDLEWDLYSGVSGEAYFEEDPKAELVLISNIHFDELYQARSGVNPKQVTAYANSMKNGHKFPPVKLAWIDEKKSLTVIDGWHRLNAVMTLGARDSAKVVRLSCQLPKQSNTKQILYFQDITAESEVDNMKSEFLYSATHELRNPIAIIFGFSELLLNTEFNRDASIDILETIHEQAKELNHLTNELLDIARIESRKGKDFSLSEEAIENILLTVRKEWAGRVEEERIILTMPTQIPSVFIDKDKIKQAISNIMSNACKYSPESSVVSIEVILDKVTSDSMVGITIRDAGFGMSTEDLDHIFERFWRSDRFRNLPGTGLGMSIVKEIIEYHQGLIEIDSAVNQGTTVTLWLPVYIDLASIM